MSCSKLSLGFSYNNTALLLHNLFTKAPVYTHSPLQAGVSTVTTIRILSLIMV